MTKQLGPVRAAHPGQTATPVMVHGPSALVIPAGSLVTVSIGRNVRDVPMPDRTWKRFRFDIGATLRHLVADTPDVFGERAVFGPFDGRGEWDGVPEDSTAWTAIAAHDVPVAELSSVFAGWAQNYGQDAIAWSYGPAMLARP